MERKKIYDVNKTWKDKITIDLDEIGCDHTQWRDLVHDMKEWRPLLHMAMHFHVL
jgi:hypothetical protein